MAREKIDNKLNIVIGTKEQVEADNTIPENSIIVVTDEELTPSDIPQLAPSKITQDADNRFVSDTEKSTWNNKVDKVTGKGLSTEDYTTTEKNKLSGIEAGAEVNVQSDWNITDTANDAFIKNKPTFSTVATTGSYNDLSGKPDLTEKLDKDFSALPNQASPLLTDVLAINRGTVAQKTTLGNLLAQVDAEIFVVVATLPTTGVVNKIYLLPKGTPEGQNAYDEYIWVNGVWELIGSVKLDLSNYYNKTEANGLLSVKVDKNNAITAGTKAKITYDSKGLVTSGADLVESDIPPLAISKITGLQTALDDLDATIGNIDSILDSILGV